ncbi:uncharacterized protein LTR77_010616 [Saxophila tyrrhenica]|uniref:Major facilitator superfamily (MFS) profile domain-containing protein n=1 Tax=Saxophila tyrrhenica TaxID=1690608 RepID=A0AAV9NV47_9PEZI|nr:hypothetical protein LTR77_010616 [Saxophila tyrrhenica]
MDSSENDIEKHHIGHRDSLHDHEIIGHNEATKEQAMHHGHLSEQELIDEKKLRRKIDGTIMPMVVLVYLMNYIDRNNYPAAKLSGLQDDLGLDDKQFQTGLSILFVGYVLMQVPSNMFLNYCGRPSYYLGFWTIAWGLVSLLTSQVTSFGGIIACRFILGFVEAPFFAGVLFYLSKWYTKSELNLRMSIFYSGSLLAGAFGNLIAGGILSGLDNAMGMRAWKWLYILEGSITIAVGILVVVVLPDFPDTWKKLSPELKRVANRRMAIDGAEADVDTGGNMSYLQGAKLAFADPKTYLLAIMYHAIVGATGFQNFFPTLTDTLGYDHVISLLLVAPPYIFIMVYALGHSIASDKIGNRFWFFIYPLIVCTIGCLVFMFVPQGNFGGRYFSLFLLNFAFASFGTIYAWISNAIPRPPAKRTVALAFMNSIGNMASIWTPYTYIDGSEPYYRPALGVVIGLLVVSATGACILRFLLIKMNRELERLENEDVELDEKELAKLRKTAEFEQIDMATARQLQKGYRYII